MRQKWGGHSRRRVPEVRRDRFPRAIRDGGVTSACALAAAQTRTKPDPADDDTEHPAACQLLKWMAG
jgi:hypothetical protein